jgi:hypothetical protein
MTRPSSPMAFPLLVAAGWVVYPAIDDEFKIQLGLMKDPNPPQPVEPEIKPEIKLVAALNNQVDHQPSKKDLETNSKILEELRRGEYKTLEGIWENNAYKVSNGILAR